MDLQPYVDGVRHELSVAAAAGGPDVQALAERLTAPLESAIRLALLEALSEAAEQITRDLAPGSVEVRPRDESRPHDVKAAEQARIKFSNGTLTVTSNRGFAFPRRGAVIVDIALPERSDLDVSVASAQVRADGRYSDCKLTSASGDF